MGARELTARRAARCALLCLAGCLALATACDDAGSHPVAAPDAGSPAVASPAVAARRGPNPLKQLDQVARDYGIEIVALNPSLPVRVRGGVVKGRPAEAEELVAYIPLFIQEFTLYPAGLVRRSHLARVVLCTELAFNSDRRNAVPVFERDTLFLDVSRGMYSRPYMRSVIHHDYFHMIDVRDDGNLYWDVAWAALNPPGTQYGNGGRAMQGSPQVGVLTDRFPGFLDEYATSGIEEDKAEVFAKLMCEPAYVESRLASDAVLGAKVGRMKEQLAGFSPDVDEAFWQRVTALKRE